MRLNLCLMSPWRQNLWIRACCLPRDWIPSCSLSGDWKSGREPAVSQETKPLPGVSLETKPLDRRPNLMMRACCLPQDQMLKKQKWNHSSLLKFFRREVKRPKFSKVTSFLFSSEKKQKWKWIWPWGDIFISLPKKIISLLKKISFLFWKNFQFYFLLLL